MASTPFLMGVFFGFVPAMGFLYILLQRYHAFFTEKRVFRSFFVGLIAGAVASIIVSGLRPQVPHPALLIGLATLIAILENLMMTAILNWRTFRARRDTPYYGVAVGLGFGAMQVIFAITAVFTVVRDDVTAWSGLFPLLLLGLHFVGGILVAAAQGAWIGRGTSVGPLWSNVLLAILARTLYLGVFYAFVKMPQDWLLYSIAFGGVAFGAILIVRATLPLLDRVVPPEVLREMDIHNRRVARRVLREEDADDQTTR